MPDLVALRERAIALTERKRELAANLDVLEGLTLKLTPAMMAHTAPEVWDEDAEGDDERMRGEVDRTYPLFSYQALLAIVGHGDFTDTNSRTFASNTLYRMRELRNFSSGSPDVERGPEPDLSGLTRFELTALVGAYTSVVSDATEALREAHYTALKIHGEQSRMPDYLKGACLGMFGKPDFATDFTYDEEDFARYNKREMPIDAGERGYMEGRNLTRLVDLHPNVLSARYLTPILGHGPAHEVEMALDRIIEVSRPLPGEPAVDRHTFSSSNRPDRIEIAYAPGEVDVDDVPEVGFRP